MDNAVDQAISLFSYRQEATGRRIPHDPDWDGLVVALFEQALVGERGSTDQEQCILQAIRITEWERGAIPKPWTKAFLPVSTVVPIVWYRRWWDKITSFYHSLLKRFNEFL